MLAPDITLNTKVYSLTSTRPNGSLRRVATRPVSEPLSLTISHETAKSGRVSTVAYIDDVAVVQIGSSAPVADNIRVMVKIQYNPLSGRTGVEDSISAAVADLVALMSAENIDKLLNREA